MILLSLFHFHVTKKKSKSGLISNRWLLAVSTSLLFLYFLDYICNHFLFSCKMSTVTRRRVAGQNSNSDDDNCHNSNTESTHNSPMSDKKIAYDPRDIDESKSTPKLTLMEEVLLLGLKDKQVNEQRNKRGTDK
jgi:hypothetical protein